MIQLFNIRQIKIICGWVSYRPYFTWIEKLSSILPSLPLWSLNPFSTKIEDAKNKLRRKTCVTISFFLLHIESENQFKVNALHCLLSVNTIIANEQSSKNINKVKWSKAEKERNNDNSLRESGSVISMHIFLVWFFYVLNYLKQFNIESREFIFFLLFYFSHYFFLFCFIFLSI